jgi:ATP-dependent RNA/DNA helicase IGHMBP2
VAVLRNKLKPLYPAVEIGSVDGFQGREKEAVVLSLVRSNSSREVGFLAEDRRLNVAITRARRHVAVVCDADTIRRHKFLAAMLDYVEVEGLEWRRWVQYVGDMLREWLGVCEGDALGICVGIMLGASEGESSLTSH